MSLWFRLLMVSTFEGWARYKHTSRESSRKHDKRDRRKLLSSGCASSRRFSQESCILASHLLSSKEVATRFLLLWCYFIIIRRSLFFQLTDPNRSFSSNRLGFGGEHGVFTRVWETQKERRSNWELRGARNLSCHHVKCDVAPICLQQTCFHI